MERFVRWRGFPRGGSCTRPSSKHGSQPSEKFAKVKWLGDIVVGTELKSNDLVGDVVLSRQHQHGNVGFAPQLLEQVEAVFPARKNEIKKNSDIFAFNKFSAHPRAIRDRRHAVSIVIEISDEHLPDPGVVIDHENTIRFHVPPSCCLCASHITQDCTPRYRLAERRTDRRTIARETQIAGDGAVNQNSSQSAAA
jgi:hypothetical protein